MTLEDLTALGLPDTAARTVLQLWEEQAGQTREWQQRHAQDTAALAQQLEQKDAGYAARQATDALRFSSQSAKKAFAAELAAAQLPYDAATQALTGFDAFVQQYREADPAAFATDGADTLPVLVKPAETPAPFEMPNLVLRHAFGL